MSSLRPPHDQRQFEGALSESAVDLAGLLAKTAFISDPELVGFEGEKIAFLRHETYRNVVCFLTDNHKFDRSSIRPAIRKLQRDVARVSHHLVFTFPLAFELLPDRGASWRKFHLRWPGFFQNERRCVPALPELTGKMAIGRQMGSDFCLPGAFVSQSAFDSESQVGTLCLEVHERRAFNSEPRNNDRPDPALATFVRQIEDEFELAARNLRRSFPTASSALRRLAKHGGSKKDGGD